MSPRQRPASILHVLILLVLGLLVAPAHGRLNIEITGGVEAAQPIAVVPFGVSDGLIPPEDVAAIISADLARTGRFRPLPTRDMLDMPSRHEEVDLRDWSQWWTFLRGADQPAVFLRENPLVRYK